MPSRKEQEMRAYWNERARQNAPWYVDTSLRFEEPDMDKFFELGREIVAYAFDDVGVSSANNRFALEIGCGLGRVCLALADRYQRVLGIDISPEMVAQARRLVPDPRVSFVIGDGSSLGLVQTASVDAIYSFTVFQHIPSVKVISNYIEEAGRVLVPGGLFVFQWNNSGGSLWWALRRGLIGVLRRLGISREERGRDDPAFLGSRLSLRRVRSALQRGGMDLMQTKNDGTLFAFVWAVRRP